MSFKSLDKLEDLTGNRYAAVLIAAKRARKINEKRLKEQEQLVEEEKVEKPGDKVTIEALDELLQGKIKFEYPKK
jgi:DNA-directed RNA polymerase omega subunit